MKRVTVTGGAGFLGQYVVETFRRNGYEVFVPTHREYDLTLEEDVVRMYAAGSALVGFNGEILWDDAMPNGQQRRCLDTSRAAALFGFRASTDFRDGLSRTIAWFRGVRAPV